MPTHHPIGNRVIILGCPGSGKSTFAGALHARTGLPLIHLDNLWWRPDRTHITREAFDRALEALLRGERWIIDGDYSRTYAVRVRACDTIVFLDLPEAECLRGISARVGKTRADMPWVDQTLDPELEDLVRRYRRENRPAVYALLARYPQKQALIFTTRAQADAWLGRTFDMGEI